MARRLWDQLHEPQTVFVVASFEMDDFNMRDVPHTKDQLLRMVAQDRIRQVHKDKWFPAHGPTDYEHWYSTRELYQVPYQRDYEPYYIVRKDVPLYVAATFSLWCGACAFLARELTPRGWSEGGMNGSWATALTRYCSDRTRLMCGLKKRLISQLTRCAGVAQHGVERRGLLVLRDAGHVHHPRRTRRSRMARQGRFCTSLSLLHHPLHSSKPP
jgi:hypothetical protein